MFRQWVSAYHLAWTPILSFDRRRATFLDWVEANLEPVAFADTSNEVGIALVSPDLRLTVTRGGFRVDSGLSALPIEVLLPAVEGLFDAMEPRKVRISNHIAMATVELKDTDLAAECARFARKLSGGEPSIAGLVPTDGSALLDMSWKEETVQIEYGVLGRGELASRLQNPSLGRLSARREFRAHRDAQFWEQEAAAVSLFVSTDTHSRGDTGPAIANPKDLLQAADKYARMVENVSVALHVAYTGDQEGAS